MTFYKSPQALELTGKTDICGENCSCELEVHFTYDTWSEPQPYGEGSTYENLAEVSHQRFYLDGEPTSVEDLNEIFYELEVEAAIERAIQDGITGNIYHD